MQGSYEFTVDWFTPHWANWLTLTAGRSIAKALEIGSFEGRSACAMIEEFAQRGPLDLFCIDTWAGSAVEHVDFDMGAVEERFDKNVRRAVSAVSNIVRVYKHRGDSVQELSALLQNGHRASFDLVFIDGSHVAADVLVDLGLAYHLCAVGGLIICDDYLWSGEAHGHENPLDMPRAAIDAFSTLFARRIEQIGGLPLYQRYMRRTS